MITDIPTPSEFEASASRFFNIAWDLIIAHVGQFSEYESEVDIDDETHAAYWKAASGDILVATC